MRSSSTLGVPSRETTVAGCARAMLLIDPKFTRRLAFAETLKLPHDAATTSVRIPEETPAEGANRFVPVFPTVCVRPTGHQCAWITKAGAKGYALRKSTSVDIALLQIAGFRTSPPIKTAPCAIIARIWSDCDGRLCALWAVRGRWWDYREIPSSCVRNRRQHRRETHNHTQQC